MLTLSQNFCMSLDMRGKKVFDSPVKGAKRFLDECQSLYGKCRKGVSEVVHPIFWPSLGSKFKEANGFLI